MEMFMCLNTTFEIRPQIDLSSVRSATGQKLVMLASSWSKSGRLWLSHDRCEWEKQIAINVISGGKTMP